MACASASLNIISSVQNLTVQDLLMVTPNAGMSVLIISYTMFLYIHVHGY